MHETVLFCHPINARPLDTVHTNVRDRSTSPFICKSWTIPLVACCYHVLDLCFLAAIASVSLCDGAVLCDADASSHMLALRAGGEAAKKMKDQLRAVLPKSVRCHTATVLCRCAEFTHSPLCHTQAWWVIDQNLVIFFFLK